MLSNEYAERYVGVDAPFAARMESLFRTGLEDFVATDRWPPTNPDLIVSTYCCSYDEHSQSAHKNELINVIYLSKQQAYIERRRAGIRYLCSKVKWQTQTLAPTGGAFTQTTRTDSQWKI
jgi:hypothetical protein